MFTPDNTEGYTRAQLDALNAELQTCVAGIVDSENDDMRQQVEKSFADEVSRRT